MEFARGSTGFLLKLLLMAGLVLSTVGILSMYPMTVFGHNCKLSFSVTLSPSSETIPRGSNFRFTIFTSGPKCLTGTHVGLFPSISPSVTNGPSFRTTSYAIPLYDAPWLVGNASSSTPTGTYTFTVTARGQQAPLVGIAESGSATLIVT
jgi:hypothetical protein